MLLVGGGAISCASSSIGGNASSIEMATSVEEALRADDIVAARNVAVAYERRVPGPESWAMLGRALWRLGQLADAEEFHRRAAGDGHPEGLLGSARVLAARGEYSAALERARPTLLVEGMAERAARFVGGLYWRLGDPEAAADTFELGAAASTGEGAAQLAALGASLREVANTSGANGWTGAAGSVTTEIVEGATWVAVEIDGVRARLRFDPMRWRSSVTPQFAARLGAGIATRELARPVAIAGLTAAMMPLAVMEAELGDGVLGFDVLVDLRWRWSPVTGELSIGTAHDRDETRDFQQSLAKTHWVSVRTVVDGLATQLLLVPRIGPRPEVATVARDGLATISAAAARELRLDREPALGEQMRLLTRVGGWQAEFDYRVVPEAGSIGQVPLAVPVALGAEFETSWIWRWSPSNRQLALIERLPG